MGVKALEVSLTHSIAAVDVSKPEWDTVQGEVERWVLNYPVETGLSGFLNHLLPFLFGWTTL
jgi:hypothetical protein